VKSGTPDVIDRCCRTVALFAVSLCCTYLEIGRSRFSLPAFASSITSAATNVFVMLATAMLVSGRSAVPTMSVPAAPDHVQ
jgi:hypothetical protein